MKIERKAKTKERIYEQKRKGEKIIVVTASRRRAMKELGRVTFSPDREREIENVKKVLN